MASFCDKPIKGKFLPEVFGRLGCGEHQLRCPNGVRLLLTLSEYEPHETALRCENVDLH
jgi:hypothetical protein